MTRMTFSPASAARLSRRACLTQLSRSALGIAAAAFVEGRWDGSRGLGIAGLVVINLVSAAVLALVALLGGGAATRRGALALWLVVGMLLVLVLFEIAYV